MEIIKIEAPSLTSAQYGQGIVTAVENINKNFNALNNPAFERGDNAAPVKSAVVDLENGTISGIDGDFGQKILDGITEALKLEFGEDFKKYYQFSQFNMYYNDLSIPTESYNFKEFIKIYLLGFSPLYVYDKKYYGLSTYNDETINKTGAYTIQYDGRFILKELSGYPKLNFIGNQWVWQIDSLKIDARGPKGEDGRDGSTYFVSIDKDNDENNVITKINGQDPQDNAQYVDQVAFALSNDDNVTIWIGYIKESERNLVFEPVKPLTAEFTDKNFLECLSHIGGNIVNVSPGLFVPINKYTDGTGPAQEQKVHMIYDSGGDTNLTISPAKLTYENNKLNWEPLETTGNLTIDYNTNISGDLTAKFAEIIGQLIASSAKIGTNTTIDVTGITTNYAKISGTLEAETDIKTRELNAGSANISGNLAANSTKIGGNTTINSDGIKTTSAVISENLTTKTVNNLKIEKDSGVVNALVKTTKINSKDVGIIQYGENGTLNNFNWHVKWYKKNGWVKVIIYAVRVENGTMITTSNWRFFDAKRASNKSVDMTDYWNNPVNNTPFSGLPKPMIPEGEDVKAFTETFTFMDYIGGLVTDNTTQDNKFSWIQWGLKYESGGFNLIPMRGNIHNLNTDGNGANNITDGNSKYYPYFEFTYPTND